MFVTVALSLLLSHWKLNNLLSIEMGQFEAITELSPARNLAVNSVHVEILRIWFLLPKLLGWAIIFILPVASSKGGIPPQCIIDGTGSNWPTG